MNRLRAVLAFGALAIAGVLGASEPSEFPTRGKEAYRAPWQDGAKVIRVQSLGPHYALVTVNPSRVIDSIRVTERTADGGLLSERTVLLLGDEYGLSQAKGKPSRAWWDEVLGIRRGAPVPPMPAPRLPGADVARPGAP